MIDIGPGAGVHGGEVVAEGPLEAIMAVPESLTGQYMSGKRKIEVPKKRVPANPEKVLKLTGARGGCAPLPPSSPGSGNGMTASSLIT